MYGSKRLFFTKLSTSPVLYRRYPDDILFIANSEQHAQENVEIMKSVSTIIRIGSLSIGTKVNFLDLSLTLVPNERPLSTRLPFVSYLGVCRVPHFKRSWSIQTELFRKVNDLIVLLDFKSNHS
jgi:hypothetical protein